MSLSSEALVKRINLSSCNGPSNATVVVVPLPKKTVGVIFGQMIAEWPQRFNTYLLDVNDNIVMDPQVLWDARSDGSRFNVTEIVPQSAMPMDSHVLSLGPYNEDRNIAIYCSHKKAGQSSYTQSDPRHTFIGGKNAITFTMVKPVIFQQFGPIIDCSYLQINAEDGGDTDYHDTVVGVAVNFMTK
ncbi:hypothetical protein JR316_0010164 [Psilocybe cubensis]|uniref:Uncharacterized protein n=2 Tax=Psilocybe cubensis TaxID=181762 RepID=A0ACB8GR82_PSICU|nr:hypothetical protein JR316_0010164 [Psilocybe cubensis]KAH9477932.1 hypothetical protein JR316_0010164 [Psilocybe cubensis]